MFIIFQVTGIQYRDKEFKLSRETKSAYYFSDNAVSDDQGADKNGTTVVQKRVVLQKVSNVVFTQYIVTYAGTYTV